MARANLAIPDGFVPLNAAPSQLMNVTVVSNNSAAIYPGHPVIFATDGSVTRTPAGSAAGAATDGISGIVTDIIQYKDSTGRVRRNATSVPASTTWTGHAERTIVQICPVIDGIRFRVMGTTAQASLAAARAIAFANADHSYGTADSGLGLGQVRLNLATVNTTNTLQWRILEFIDMPANDPTQANFQCVVIPNLPFAWPITGQSLTAI